MSLAPAPATTSWLLLQSTLVSLFKTSTNKLDSLPKPYNKTLICSFPCLIKKQNIFFVASTVAKTTTLLQSNSHLRRLRELLALELASARDRMALQLLLLELYGRRESVVLLDEGKGEFLEGKGGEEE